MEINSFSFSSLWSSNLSIEKILFLSFVFLSGVFGLCSSLFGLFVFFSSFSSVVRAIFRKEENQSKTFLVSFLLFCCILSSLVALASFLFFILFLCSHLLFGFLLFFSLFWSVHSSHFPFNFIRFSLLLYRINE